MNQNADKPSGVYTPDDNTRTEFETFADVANWMILQAGSDVRPAH